MHMNLLALNNLKLHFSATVASQDLLIDTKSSRDTVPLMLPYGLEIFAQVWYLADFQTGREIKA